MRKTRKGGGANNYGINKQELTNAIRRMSNTNGFQKKLNTMKAKINSMNGNLNRRGVTRSNWVPNESVVTNNRNFGSQQQTLNQLQKNANQVLSPNVPIGRQMPNKKNIHAAINQGNLVQAATMLNDSNPGQNYIYNRNKNGNPISLITNNGSAVNANKVYNGNESTNSLSTIDEGNNMSDLYESPENLRQEQSAGGCGCGLKFSGKRTRRLRR